MTSISIAPLSFYTDHTLWSYTGNTVAHKNLYLSIHNSTTSFY